MRRLRPLSIVAASFAVALALAAACGGNEDVHETTPLSPSPIIAQPGAGTPRSPTSLELPTRIAVSLPVFEDFVRQAAGDHATVFSFVPPGVDPREYELTDEDIAKLADVTFFYVNGLGIDDHIQRTIEANKVGRYFVIPFGPNVRSPTDSPKYADEAGDEPHLWLDPDLAAVYVAIVADEFVIYDGVNRSYYNERFSESRTYLKELAAELARQVSVVPDERRKLVAHSEAVSHIARRFGLELLGTVEDGPTGETEEQTVERLAALVRSEGVPAVFAEYGHDDAIIAAVAAEAGVELCVLYTDIASEDLLGYEEMVRANVAEIIRCLGE